MQGKSFGPSVLLIGLIFFFGIAALLWGAIATGQAFDSLSWPTAEGVITSDQVTEGTDSDNTTMYSAEVIYSYQVNGQTFTGSKVSFGDYSSSSPSDAEEVVNRYPAGKAVKVHYNPQDYRQAVLEPGFSTGLWIPLGVGTVFILVALFLVYGLVKSVFNGQITLPWARSASPQKGK